MVSLKEMARSDVERAPPAWLLRLLETTFFDACPEHPSNEGRANRRTTGCNFFCIQCVDRALCSGCLSAHEEECHELIQIRKSSGSDVVKVKDVQHLLNVSLVQTYQYNGEHVIFLNKRPMVGQGKSGISHCEECGRGLRDKHYRFCSLGCMAKEIQDGLDFNVSFAVNTNNNSSGASSSKPVAARGQHSSESE